LPAPDSIRASAHPPDRFRPFRKGVNFMTNGRRLMDKLALASTSHPDPSSKGSLT